jgi:hypothetical protein
MALITCPDCSNEVSDKAASCPKCGHPIASGATAISTIREAPTEKTYYSDQQGIRITSTRAIIDNKTYSMANVSSVARGRVPASYGGAIVMMMIGLLLALGGFGGSSIELGVTGLLVLVVGIVIAASLKDTWTVRITAASGEMDALRSKNKQYVDTVVNAINEAIVGRG